MEFPEPVISLSVEPKSKADQDKMTTALQKLQEEDPTFRAETNYRDWSNHHLLVWVSFTLDIIVDRMRREFKVEANVGAPQVAYRETFPLVQLKLKVNSLVNLVVVDNSVTFGLSSNLTKKEKALNLRTKSLVV